MSLPMATNRSQNFNVNNNNTSLNQPKRAKLVGENWHHNSSRGGGATKPHLNEMDSDPPNEDAANKRATSLPPNIGSLTSRNVIYLDMRNRNIKMDGAYSVSQVIKTENSTLEVVDISENNLEDDGLMYISIALKMCKYLKSLNLSSAAFTEYGLRILLENLNSSHLKYLNVSGNLIGNKGIEHLVKFLPSSKLDHLSLNSIGIDDEGAKLLGFAMSTNSTVRILEIGWNNIKQIGAVAISRGLVANSQIEELYMTCNSFGVDGSSSLSECLKINRSLRSIDLSNNRLNYDSAKVIASALRQNSTLRFLNLSQNNISISGVYDLLSAINSESSGLEYLGLKNIPIQKNLVLLVELIQQRRRFTCDYGSVIIYPDASSSKLFTEDESMIKLARYLSDKRLRLVDMFRILDKDSSLEISKNDFKRRLKIFEPRLTPKDIIAITKNLCNNKEFINYSSLLNQTSKRFDIEGEITRRRAQINAEDERSTKVFKAQANNNPKQSQNQEEPPKADLIPTRESFETNIKERSIDSPSINLSPNNSSSTYRSVNSKTKLKPISDSSVISSNASSTISNKRNYRINKNFRSVDYINNKSQEKEQNFSSA